LLERNYETASLGETSADELALKEKNNLSGEDSNGISVFRTN
jgi:hypothetical protein